MAETPNEPPSKPGAKKRFVWWPHELTPENRAEYEQASARCLAALAHLGPARLEALFRAAAAEPLVDLSVRMVVRYLD